MYDLWTFLWVVGISDFVVKFSVIIIKSLIALQPPKVIAFKRKVRQNVACRKFPANKAHLCCQK